MITSSFGRICYFFLPAGNVDSGVRIRRTTNYGSVVQITILLNYQILHDALNPVIIFTSLKFPKILSKFASLSFRSLLQCIMPVSNTGSIIVYMTYYNYPTKDPPWATGKHWLQTTCQVMRRIPACKPFYSTCLGLTRHQQCNSFADFSQVMSHSAKD